MRKILQFTLVIFSYNFFLLILPLIIFIISLSFASQAPVNILPWIYSPFILISPILTIILGYLVIRNNLSPFSGVVPIFMSLIGNFPFLCTYYLLNPLWSLSELFLLIGLPILFGVLSDLAKFLVNSLRISLGS